MSEGMWTSSKPMMRCMFSAGGPDAVWVWQAGIVLWEGRGMKVFIWDSERSDFYPILKNDPRARFMKWV